jgi:hypothetical protein
MAAGKNVDTSTLAQWAGNFRNHKDLTFGTNTAAVSLEQLENYIAEVKSKYSKYSDALNGFRIYFIRYPLGAAAQAKVENAGRSLSQPSLVMVPLKEYNPSNGSGDDLVLDNPGDVYVLAFSDPESTDPGDSTALCPPKCGGG